MKEKCVFKESGIAWLGKIPKHWNKARGVFLFFNKKELNSNLQCKERLSLTMEGVIERDIEKNDGLNPADFRTYQIFEKDNLVFKLIDLDNIKTSRVGYVYKKGIMSSAYIRLIPKKLIYSKYFYYQYYDLYLKHIFNYLGTGVRSTLNSDELLNIKVVYPPLKEQKAIADFLDKKCELIEEFIIKKEQLITLLEEKKQALINEVVSKGLNKNAKFKESGIDYLGQIPTHWEVIRLGLVFSVESGTTPKSDNRIYYDNGNFIWVNSGDLNDNILLDSKRKITQKALDDYPFLKIFKKESVVIAMYGATIGKTAILGVDAFCNQACCVLEKNLLYENLYLFYWFNGYRKELISMGNGGGQPNISQDIIKNLKIPLPPLEEQKAIAAYLDTQTQRISSIITKIKAQIKLMREYKSSLISEATCGRMIIEERI